MMPVFFNDIFEWICVDFLLLMTLITTFSLIIIQKSLIKKLNSFHETQRQQSPYLDNLNSLLASLQTSGESTSQAYEKMATELKNVLIVNAGHREIVLQNLDEIQAMIEDVKQELITKEIARHRLNTFISESFKKST
jgi:hypothetical protein